MGARKTAGLSVDSAHEGASLAENLVMTIITVLTCSLNFWGSSWEGYEVMAMITVTTRV